MNNILLQCCIKNTTCHIVKIIVTLLFANDDLITWREGVWKLKLMCFLNFSPKVLFCQLELHHYYCIFLPFISFSLLKEGFRKGKILITYLFVVWMWTKSLTRQVNFLGQCSRCMPDFITTAFLKATRKQGNVN